MMFRRAFPVMVLIAAGACSGSVTTAPAGGERARRADAAAANAAANEANDEGSPRSGELQIVKDCSQYTALAGSFCTITSSNLRAIPAGTRIVYQEGVAAGVLETDVILYPPTGGSIAFGHVSLQFASAHGVGSLLGGTGRFKHLTGTFDITPLPTPGSWALAGTYSFGSEDRSD